VFFAEGIPLVPNVYVDNSLLTAVLVGVLLLWWLGERVGWPQSGLVVPGYLAGILVIRPEIGVIIGIEGLLTYLLARFFGTILPQLGPFDRPFGRDRFLIVLLSSVAVRLFVEAGPAAGAFTALGLGQLGEMHSLGFVLVPLLANALWMPGMFRGVPLVVLPIMAVYFILTTILIPYTNLNLSDFAFTYENLSTDFLSAPRAYILLLVGAFLAAHLNLRYGWEFGGILIPGLLAIAWDEPLKVGATFLEVGAIVFVIRILVIGPLKRVDISGMRPLVLAFVLSWLLKTLIALIWGTNYPGFVASEVFGFGYLLPALIAVRCWRRGDIGRVIIPTAMASYFAFVLGTSISGLLNPSGNEAINIQSSVASTAEAESIVTGTSQVFAAELLAEGVTPLTSLDILPAEMVSVAMTSAFAQRSLELREHSLSTNFPEGGAQPLYASVEIHPDGALVTLGENQERVWTRSDAMSGIFFVVPEAGSEAGLLEASIELCNSLDGHGVATAASPTLLSYLRDSGFFIVEVATGEETRLVSQGELGQGVDLGAIRGLLPQVEFEFGAAEVELETPIAPSLSLSSGDVIRLANMKLAEQVSEPAPEETTGNDNDSMFIGEWSPSIHVDHTSDWLATLDRGVLLPLIEALSGNDDWLALASWYAERLGLSINSDEDFVYLTSAGDPNHTSWRLVLRRELDNSADSLIVEVPVGGREFRTSRIGRAWFDATNGAAILVHNALADKDIFEITRQREFAPEVTILRRLVLAGHGDRVVSVRAYRQDEYPGADAVLSTGEPVANAEGVDSPTLEMVETLVQRSGGTSTLYTGAPNQVRFHDPTNYRRRAVHGAGGEWVTTYLSPTYRIAFPPLSSSPSLLASLQAAGLSTREYDMDEISLGDRLTSAETQSRFGRVLDSLSHYGQNGHPGQLERLVATAQRTGVRLSIVVEPEEQLPLLLAKRGSRLLLAPLGNFQGQIADDSMSLSDSVQAGAAYAVSVSQ
jgi:hypothetical protein